MVPTQRKFAYLVMAHGQFRLLRCLLSLLDDERNDIFIHLDAKVQNPPCEELRSAVRHSGLYFIDERHDVRWGSSVQSRAELGLYAAAAAQGPYSRYFLMSGACLPLRSQEVIHQFFEQEAHQGKNFLVVFDDYTRQHYRRLAHYHFSHRDPFSRLAKHVLKLFPWIDRIRGRFEQFAVGYNWCSLTQEAVDYLVERRHEIQQLLKHTTCADEVYRQLLFMNAPELRETIYRDAEGETPNLWMVDWSAGGRHPAVFTMEDIPRLLASPCLFARKFSEEHMDAVEAIVRHVRA